MSPPWPSINSSLWNATKSLCNKRAQRPATVCELFYCYPRCNYITSDASRCKRKFYAACPTRSAHSSCTAIPPLWNPVITTHVVTTDQLLLPGDTMSMTVLWNSSAVTARQYSYRVYYARSDVTAPGAALAAVATTLPCATSSDTVSAADGSLLPGVAPVYASPDRCVITTACGVHIHRNACGRLVLSQRRRPA